MKIRPETLLEAQEIASSITRYIQVFLYSSDDEKQIHSVVDLTKDELDERILWSMEAPESDYENFYFCSRTLFFFLPPGSRRSSKKLLVKVIDCY